MSFRYVLREIQLSKILTLVLKPISFESENSLWSSSIKQKNWENIEDIYLTCLPKFQRVWGDFKEVARSLILWR
jgi:hypothetical protein